jgi:glycosyltransferase involved in cell wall biosynthesis
MRLEERIYLVGSTYGSYRARALLEYLAASPKYCYFHKDPHFLVSKNRSFFCRLLFKGLRIFDKILSLLALSISDVVYILPMSNVCFFEKIVIRILRKKVIGEFYISMYDTFVNDRKTVKKSSMKALKLLKSDQQFIDICDHIVFLNASEREYYLAITERPKDVEKTTLIPLTTNLKDRANLPFANKKRDKVILCWWGTFIPLHGLDKIIESAVYLKKVGLNFSLYLFGTSEELSKVYREKIEQLNLSDCVSIDNTKNFSDKSLDIFLIENCDIAFGNFGDSEKAKTVMINKIVESTSMTLPVVSQKTKALTEYFKDNESIYFCESHPQKIAEKVLDITKDKQQMIAVAQSSFELYVKYFSKKVYLREIVKMFDKVNK